MRRSWSVMVASYSSFQACTRATKSSRLKSSRRRPSASSRFSTTVWVAMPAWSVPGIQRVAKPRMRWTRTRMSCTVLFIACPRCRAAVTLGGGMSTA